MPTKSLNLEYNAQFSLRTPQDSKGVILLLHGYLQDGETLFKLLQNYLPQDWTVIAPNAPLPLAHKYGNRLKLAYTWYLYDPPNDHYLLDMNFACSYLKSFLSGQVPAGHPLKVIGYSQGGYLAPFAALNLDNVVQVIGLNCRFRSEAISSALPFRLDALHGEDDPMVDPARAKKCHEDILAIGTCGEFRFVPNTGHRITPSLGTSLREVLTIV